MLNEQFPLTRRDFLGTGLKGLGLVAASSYVPAFVTRTAYATAAEKDQPILVVLQLSGGNDGLNTVIPFTDDTYYKARPTLGIAADKALKLNDTLGLNPALQPLQALYDEGQMAVIQNVGYPNPDRSHFRSMDVWHTGQAPKEPSSVTGWLGRYFDAECQGHDTDQNKESLAAIGMNFGKVMPRAFRNQSNVGIALEDPTTFRWNPSGETSGLVRAQNKIFAKLNRPTDTAAKAAMPSPFSDAVIESDPATLDFLKHTAMNAVVSGDEIRKILTATKKGAKNTPRPQSRLGQELQMISKLIGGNFPTRVYYAKQGGYDTHANQAVTQSRLFREMSTAVTGFLADMKAQGNEKRVIVMAFSEFGRRVEENGSAGTDHGAAAPMFLFGQPVAGGIHGTSPDLSNLERGDLRFSTDFRQVYAAVLNNWLQTDPTKILGSTYPGISLFAAQPNTSA